MDNHNQPKHTTATSTVYEMAARAMAVQHGDAAAREMVQDCERLDAARREIEAKQADARKIAKVHAEHAPEGEPELTRTERAELAAAELAADNDRKAVNPRKAKAKQAQRARKAMASRVLSTHKRMLEREREAAEALSEAVFRKHGIRHYFRPLPKAAWFAGHTATYDRDGVLALETLASCGMPAWRIVQVLNAATRPLGYSPTRDVCKGERADQTLYEYDGRELGGGAAHRNLWGAEGQRLISHPAAIRVVACAVFLWMAKTRTGRNGMTYRIHGFGHGVFETMCRCERDALFGHENGMPGALLALKLAGFVQYHQPPADQVRAIDRGPTGHAYTMFWIPATADDAAMCEQLEEARELLAQMGRECLREHWLDATAANDTRPPPKPPPDPIDPATIPF